MEIPYGISTLIIEYVRPWKLITFGIGVLLTIVGACYDLAPDWDIPVSIIMDTFAYLAAPWSLRVILERKWRLFPIMLFVTWFTVDGCYAIYWHFRNPDVLEAMREANFGVSLALYGICGVIWLYQGSLKQMYFEVHKLVK